MNDCLNHMEDINFDVVILTICKPLPNGRLKSWNVDDPKMLVFHGDLLYDLYGFKLQRSVGFSELIYGDISWDTRN